MITIKKHDKEILQATIDSEKAVIKQIKQAYEQALKDINDQLAGLMSRADSDRQYVVYQKEYQEALQAQISGILDQLNAKEFDSVADYLNECYKDGFISALYSLNKQGIPLIMPIDQRQVVQAVQLDSKISKGLYTRLGEDIKSLKKTISRQISRGLAGGMSYGEIARNIANSSRTGYNNAIRISRTEGNRIQNTAAMDAARKSKELGCDTKKQWLATLDGDTRKSHAQVDGEIKDLDEPFSNGLMYPGDPDGRAAEVVNCRCALAEVAAWALDEKELERLQRNAEFFGIDKTESLEQYRSKYLQIYRSSGKAGDSDGYTTIDEVIPFDFSDNSKIQAEIQYFFKKYAYAEEEHAIVISPTNQLFRLTGSHGSVNTSLVGENALVGSIGMHNHPVWDGYDSGDSFSKWDIMFSLEHKTGIEYLVTGNKTYSFEYTGKLTPSEMYVKYNEALFKAREFAFNSELELDFEQEETMRILAKELEGFVYSENI